MRYLGAALLIKCLRTFPNIRLNKQTTRVRNGATVLLGFMLKRKVAVKDLPLLRSLPVLGEYFRDATVDELLVAVTLRLAP